MQHYRERRKLLDCDVRILRGEDDVDANLRDATRTGLRIISDLHIEAGEDIVVKGSDWTLDGSVVWTGAGEFGVRLAEALSRNHLQRLTGKSVRLNRRSRVGFGDS